MLYSELGIWRRTTLIQQNILKLLPVAGANIFKYDYYLSPNCQWGNTEILYNKYRFQKYNITIVNRSLNNFLLVLVFNANLMQFGQNNVLTQGPLPHFFRAFYSNSRSSSVDGIWDNQSNHMWLLDQIF